MKLYQIFLHIEIQSEYKVVYYDYKQEKRIEVAEGEHTDKDIAYLYVEDGILYIEIDIDEDWKERGAQSPSPYYDYFIQEAF